jgi:hydrogenase-4 component B
VTGSLMTVAFGLLALGAGVDLIAGVTRRWARPIPYSLALLACACLLTAGVHVTTSQTQDLSLHGLFGIGHSSLRLDGLSGFFLTLLFGLGVAISACFVSWSLSPSVRHARGIATGYLLLLASSALIVTAADAFTFLFFWETLSVTFYMLAASPRAKEDQATGAWATLAFGKIGGAALLLGFLLLASNTGSLAISSWTHVPSGALHDVAFALLIVGFGTKLGLVPLQAWLPVGYPAAPGPARAAMAGLAVNVGVYGLLRFLGVLGRPPVWLAVTVLLIGGITGLLGISFAAAQDRLARVVAYSSVESAGIIATAYGVALTGAAIRSEPLVAVGLLAATLFTVAHAIAKSALFSATADFESSGADGRLDGLRGIGRSMPYSGFAFAAGSLTLAGLPPTIGFVAEWFVLEALLQQFRVHGLALKLGLAGAGALIALTTGLAALAFLRVVGLSILGPKQHLPGSSSASSVPGRVAVVLLGIACLGFGAVTPWEIRYIARGLASVVPEHVTEHALKSPWVLQPIFHNFSILSPSWLWIAMPLAFSAVAVTAVALSGGRFLRTRRVPAWRSATAGVDGVARYTSSGYATPLRHVLANVLGTENEVELIERPEEAETDIGPHVEYRARVIEPVETYLIEPIGRFALATARIAKRLQSGRLDAYVAYMLVALIAALATVAALY